MCVLMAAVSLGIASPTAPSRAADTAYVDTAASVVRWKGTKFGGRGAHAGTVKLRRGWVVLNGMRLTSARFIIDMRSIAISDIPRADDTPRQKLLSHLLADDFFAVQRYPTAEFVIDRAENAGAYVYRLDGRLTLRGVTRSLRIDANVWSFEPSALHATARFTIDRMQWGIAFRGSRLTNDLVDDDISLELDLVARVPSARVPSTRPSS